MAKDKELERYKRAMGELHDALYEYAQPEFYHAVGFMVDRPAGGFADDFERKHGDPDYRRPMPGKLARKTLARLRKKYGDLVIISRAVT